MPTYTKKKIKDYYRAVRLSNAFVLVFTAILFVFGAILYYFFSSPISFGAIVVIYSFGIIQALISLIRFIRSFKEYKTALLWVDTSDRFFIEYELPKLQKRHQQVNWARKAEIVCLTFFFGMTILAVLLKDQYFLFGSSAVLLVQLSVMLCYDLIRQYHIREYIRQIEKLK